MGKRVLFMERGLSFRSRIKAGGKVACGFVLSLVLSLLLFSLFVPQIHNTGPKSFSPISTTFVAFFPLHPESPWKAHLDGSENNFTASSDRKNVSRSTSNYLPNFHDDGVTVLNPPADYASDEKRSFEGCDLFDGKWVRDDGNRFYPPGSCPYVDTSINCHANGKPNSDFLNWRWQPNHCDIPRMNATDFLERLRGQRLIFVGDSLNRNMWESLVCTLRHAVANKERVFEVSGGTEFKARPYSSIKFTDYNCTVEYARAPYLVKQIIVKEPTGERKNRVRLDMMERASSIYSGADIMIFNTGHWWGHEKTGKNCFQVGDYVYPYLPLIAAYERGLATWGKWVDENVDRDKTHVFFRGFSLGHFRGGRWNSGGTCHNETEPIYDDSFLEEYPPTMRVVEKTLKKMSTSVTYLNITRLTGYRKDAHPSVYRRKFDSVEDQIASMGIQDCSHWCLPGVPDAWNELLYVSLLQSGRGPWKF